MNETKVLSVITRTRDRPALLARAARSIAAARVDGMQWIVVEDAPDASETTRSLVEEVRSSTAIDCIISSVDAGHRAIAANHGLSLARGRYLHFHDDDDAVAPSFYRACTQFLDENARYAAVRAMCDRVDETPRPDGTIVETRRRPHYPERRAVSFSGLAEVFYCPPIGTLWRTEQVVAAGGFDNNFAVGEDYDLTLRVLRMGDIATIGERLASFHVRPGGNSRMHTDFPQEDASFRNAMLRRDLANNDLGLGWLLTLGTVAHSAGLYDFSRRAFDRFVGDRLRGKRRGSS